MEAYFRCANEVSDQTGEENNNIKEEYCVNKNAQDSGDHEMHKSGCKWMPKSENRQYLDKFSNCKDALKEAKKYYEQADGCSYCCSTCDTD